MMEITPGWWWCRALEGHLYIVMVAKWSADWDFANEDGASLAAYVICDERPHNLRYHHFVCKVDPPSL